MIFWWNVDPAGWYLSTGTGSVGNYWNRLDPEIIGEYQPGGAWSGTPDVAAFV
ncbi:MAG TPA: hypothetical protein VM223_16470 [Planctomycetota bacterium]|nr:hypothetical protein [Planctomycetota bacterium]